MDMEARHSISENSSHQEEKDSLLRLWDKEVNEAEPKARSLCQREINFQQKLPETDPYLGFHGLKNSDVSPQNHHNNVNSGHGPDNGLYSRRSDNERPGERRGGYRTQTWEPRGRQGYNQTYTSNTRGRNNYGYDQNNRHFQQYGNPNFQYRPDQASLY